MRGHGAASLGDPNNKWTQIKDLIRKNKIGILALQETHSNPQYIESVNDLYKHTLHVVNSANPERPNAHGVALVINKRLLPTDEMQTWPLIPGRAILARIRWHKDNYLNILAVYAPNDPTQNATFWLAVHTQIAELGLTKPDITLGDFNLVEDAIDRLPSHSDQRTATDNLQYMIRDYELNDGWRVTNPDSLAFTFGLNNIGSKSRIDRIYVTKTLLDTAQDWKITHSDNVNTDHQLISVKLSNKNVPYVGPGRWNMPKLLLQDKEVIEFIQEKGLNLEQNTAAALRQRTSENNPQRLFREFKIELTTKLRQRARIAVPKIEATIRKLQTNLDTLLQKGMTLRNDQDELSIALIQ
ncbi:Endonuclease/exonuclease/phosphatase, partial [Irpex rosettiformis]